MTAGRIVVLAILGGTALFAVFLWWTNTRAYYVEVDNAEIGLQRPDGAVMAIETLGLRAIDADTSPLRFRACFALEPAVAPVLMADAVSYDDPTPLTAPSWFDCYDADAVGADLEAGRAQAYLGERNIQRGVDRVVAIYPDGTGFAWHQLNGTLEE